MEGLPPPLNSLWDSDHSASLWFGLVWFCAVPFPGALPSLPLTLGWAWQRRGQISAISVWNHLGEGLFSGPVVYVERGLMSVTVNLLGNRVLRARGLVSTVHTSKEVCSRRCSYIGLKLAYCERERERG